jgi:hypothetical protein
MSSASIRPGPLPGGLVLRACAFVVAGLLPGVAAVASVPRRPSADGLLLYVGVTGLFLLAVPAVAASGAVSSLALGALAAVLPRVRFDAGSCHVGAAGLGTAVGVFRGRRGLDGLLDDLRHRLARRGPPALGGAHAV